MKRLSILAAAALASLALTAAIGTGSAAATALCKYAEPLACIAPQAYPAGTNISASVKSGTKVKFLTNGGSVWSECSGGSVNLRTTTIGGGEKVPVNTESKGYSLTGCTFATTFESYGEGAIQSQGANLYWGNFYDSGTRFKMSSALWGSCTYSLGTFYLTGGSAPGFKMESTAAARVAGSAACPEILKVSGEYTISSPTPLYVSSSVLY